jgi:3-(3-hydroxy-phenyl)propionate hydroxylase
MVHRNIQYPFQRPDEMNGIARIHDVVIVGAGPVGLTFTLALARHGVRATLIEADCQVSEGSRALGMSRRTLDIWDALGAAEPVAKTGLKWSRGTSFYRGRTVLEFEMDTDTAVKFPPMINIQQCFSDQYLVNAIESACCADIRWQSRCVAVKPAADHVDLEVSTPEGDYWLQTKYLVACDGGRSFIRGALGLEMEGLSFGARYIIVDVRLQSEFPPGRRAWFDPVSNPGSTVLMHRQPDDIWRIDYQVLDDESLEAELKPEMVRRRVARHLEMIGEHGDWEIEWISSYRAHGLTLTDYRAGQVMFAGDAAHLTPIFGIRGLNSGVEDAWTLGWMLSYVLKGRGSKALLDAYSIERVALAREYIKQGSRSAALMAPPTRGMKLARDAVLSLALSGDEYREVLHPRQGTTAAVSRSVLSSFAERSAAFERGAELGEAVPNVAIVSAPNAAARRPGHLHALLDRTRFTAILFGSDEGTQDLVDWLAGMDILPVVAHWPRYRVLRNATAVLGSQELMRRFGARAGTVYLVRPDHLVCARWLAADRAEIEAALKRACGLDPEAVQ